MGSVQLGAVIVETNSVSSSAFVLQLMLVENMREEIAAWSPFLQPPHHSRRYDVIRRYDFTVENIILMRQP